MEIILSLLDFKFDFIGITESKIKKNIAPIIDIQLEGYNHFSTPTEGEKGGSLLYIADRFVSRPRNDLEKIMYKSLELESTFREIILKNKKNIIVGCIYRHPNMDLTEFNDLTSKMLEKLNKENKKVHIMGDFNIDLMKIDKDTTSATFFDNMTSNLFVPHIILPTRITGNSKTLIDNIFTNLENFKDGLSGNLTLSISDHLAQFLIIPHRTNQGSKKQTFYKRDTRSFDQEDFILDILDINWKSVIRIEEKDPNLSFNSLYDNINDLVNKHLPLTKVTKKEMRSQSKPWINNEIKVMIKERDKFKRKYIQAKDEVLKEQHHNAYKTLRNQIVNLCRSKKKQYYESYFSSNANNMKNIWKGINEVIKIKEKNNIKPISILSGNEICNDPKKIADEFNKYFSTVASNLQKEIYNAGEGFDKYLKNPNNSSFFIKPSDKNEIIQIISSFQQGKSLGPNSFPDRILQLIKFEIAEPLAEIINLSYETGIYCDKLKIANTIPIYKDKGSELDCSNYRPISLLSNINKIFEKLNLCTIGFMIFWKKTNASTKTNMASEKIFQPYMLWLA